jgi:hypothetical protein
MLKQGDIAMDSQTGRVLKADEVKIEGTYRLDINRPVKRAANPGTSVSSSPQVRIVENNAEYVVVELTCGCGNKTRVRCEYGQNS